MSETAVMTLSSEEHQHAVRRAWTALLQVLVLTGLWLVLIRDEYHFFGIRMLGDSEAAHALAAPALIGLLVYLRKNELVHAMRSGSLWGLVLIVFALLMFAVFTWPFFIGYPRQIAIVPAVAGFILLTAGWRVLKLCVPMLIVLLLAIPIGWRQYAFLMIHPETYTFDAVDMALNLLPGVVVSMDGPDMTYLGSQGSGTIALGDPHRGASLFLAMAMIGAFITFAKIRPLWQIAVVAVFAGPILLLCNFLRLFMHGVITIYGGFDALSAFPRMAAAAITLLLVYILFAMMLGAVSNVVKDEAESEGVTSNA